MYLKHLDTIGHPGDYVGCLNLHGLAAQYMSALAVVIIAVSNPSVAFVCCQATRVEHTSPSVLPLLVPHDRRRRLA